MVQLVEDFDNWAGMEYGRYLVYGDIKFDDGILNLSLSFEKSRLLGVPLNKPADSIIGSYKFRGKLKVDGHRTYYNFFPPFRQTVDTGRKRNRRL